MIIGGYPVVSELIGHSAFAKSEVVVNFAFPNQVYITPKSAKTFVVPAHSRLYNWFVLRNPAILDRVIASKQGDFPLDSARQVLRFTFPPEDRARYEKLSYKAQDGSLTEKERAELEDYVNIHDLLIVLKAKAEASLRDQSPPA